MLKACPYSILGIMKSKRLTLKQWVVVAGKAEKRRPNKGLGE